MMFRWKRFGKGKQSRYPHLLGDNHESQEEESKNYQIVQRDMVMTEIKNNT